MRTVLIVDDNVTLAYFTARNLIRDIPDLDVITSASCSEAKVEAARVRPSLIIADYKLQDGSGHTLIREIRQTYPNVAAILISGENVPEDLLGQGLFGFLQKPYEAEALLNLVKSALIDSKPPIRNPQGALSVQCKGYDRHLVQNRLAGLLAGLRAFGADLRFQAEDPQAVLQVLDEYLDRLCRVVVEVSGMLPDCPVKGKTDE